MAHAGPGRQAAAAISAASSLLAETARARLSPRIRQGLVGTGKGSAIDLQKVCETAGSGPSSRLTTAEPDLAFRIAWRLLMLRNGLQFISRQHRPEMPGNEMISANFNWGSCIRNG
jgi:hypothetical protein